MDDYVMPVSGRTAVSKADPGDNYMEIDTYTEQNSDDINNRVNDILSDPGEKIEKMIPKMTEQHKDTPAQVKDNRRVRTPRSAMSFSQPERKDTGHYSQSHQEDRKDVLHYSQSRQDDVIAPDNPTDSDMLEQFFKKSTERSSRMMSFVRINGYNDAIKAFLWEYHEEARKNGTIVDGRIQNPDERQLSYYQDILGLDFSLSVDFIKGQLSKWVPNMNADSMCRFAEAVFRELKELQTQGKTLSILKNVYIKMMCWLYYKFEQLIENIGMDYPPKILYFGTLTAHELIFLRILNSLGADIVLVQAEGDSSYRKLDPESKYSCVCEMNSLAAFPEGYNLKQLRMDAQRWR